METSLSSNKGVSCATTATEPALRPPQPFPEPSLNVTWNTVTLASALVSETKVAEAAHPEVPDGGSCDDALPVICGTPEKRKHRGDGDGEDDDPWLWPCVLPSPDPFHWPCEHQGTHSLLPYNTVNKSLTMGAVCHYLLQDLTHICALQMLIEWVDE